MFPRTSGSPPQAGAWTCAPEGGDPRYDSTPVVPMNGELISDLLNVRRFQTQLFSDLYHDVDLESNSCAALQDHGGTILSISAPWQQTRSAAKSSPPADNFSFNSLPLSRAGSPRNRRWDASVFAAHSATRRHDRVASGASGSWEFRLTGFMADPLLSGVSGPI